MSNFGWSYPAGCTGTPYDEEYPCDVCGEHTDLCGCSECEECGAVGGLECYRSHGMKPGPLSVGAFIDAIGVATTLQRTLRAIDKHNLEHVWLVLADGLRLYYHSARLDEVPHPTVIRRIGAGCIAWDGSDWEYSCEEDPRAYRDMSECIEAARADVSDAYEDYVAMRDAEDEDHPTTKDT